MDRSRLAQVLGMMGSAHDGEALNAARLAVRMIKEAGATWPDLLDGGQERVAVEAARVLLAKTSSSSSKNRNCRKSWRGCAVRHCQRLGHYRARQASRSHKQLSGLRSSTIGSANLLLI